MDVRIFIILVLSTVSSAEVTENTLQTIRKVYDHCSSKEEIIKCWKIQALKAVDRAFHWRTLPIVNGVSLISTTRQERTFFDKPPLNESKLERLNSEEIDGLLVGTTARFLNDHRVQVEIPKLVEEGRKKSKGGNGALLWALAIKGSFLAMAYKGIAVMSGTALIVGKMALMLAAILGLKKLVSQGHEKTTFEIVKVPKHSESHSYSSSYEDEGHYRSFNIDESVTTKINPYKGQMAKI